MANLTQLINIILNFKQKGAGQAKKAGDNLGKMSKRAKTLTLASKKLGVSTARLEQGLKMQGLEVGKSGKVFDKLTGRIVKQAKAMKKAKNMTRRFQMEWLGIMFMGMALSRFFTGIMRAATGAFTKIMESSQMLGTAIQRLAVHWEYLKFIVGSAINKVLEPLMPMIIGLISAISEWIQKHSKLTAWILFLGLVLGTLFLVIGQTMLGVNALLGVLAKLGISLSLTASGVLLLLGKLLILALGFYVAWKFARGFFDGLGDSLGASETDMSRYSDVVKDFLFDMGVMAKMLGRTFAMVLHMLFGLLKISISAFTLGVSAVIDVYMTTIESLVNLAISAINLLIKAYQKLPKRFRIFGELEQIGKISLPRIAASTDFIKDTWKEMGEQIKDWDKDLAEYDKTWRDLWGSKETKVISELSGAGAAPGVFDFEMLRSLLAEREDLEEINRLRKEANIEVNTTYNIGGGEYTLEELRAMLEQHDKDQLELIRRNA